MRGIRSTIACMLLSLSSFAAIDQVKAATVDTFSFSQSGYDFGNLALSGTFTGTVESAGPYSGFIELGDLSNISFSLSSLGTPTANSAISFSFNVDNFLMTGLTTSLSLEGRLSDGTFACIGAYAALGVCGAATGPATFVINGDIGDGVPGDSSTYTTSNFATVTLVSTTTTPLPPTWTMLLSGIVALGFFAYRETKKSAALAAA
jgi:hypothetical protein